MKNLTCIIVDDERAVLERFETLLGHFDFLLKPIDLDEFKETIDRYRQTTTATSITNEKNQKVT